MSEHSIFSPSASHRILSCPPSLMLCARAEEETSAYAAEGTCAHELCAYLVEKALGRDVQDPTENLDYYNAEMQACAEGYAEFVMGEYAKAKAACPDAEVLVEQRVDISRWVPGCGGTADCIILSDAQVEIIDYKHGVGVPVSASSEEYGGNPQLMCYCLGVLAMFDGIYDFDTVKMAIFQPRRENVSEYTMSKADLLAWAEDTLVPTARLALEGKGEFRAGDHCRFCKVKATCRKRAEINLEAAQYDFAQPATLDPCGAFQNRGGPQLPEIHVRHRGRPRRRGRRLRSLRAQAPGRHRHDLDARQEKVRGASRPSDCQSAWKAHARSPVGQTAGDAEFRTDRFSIK